MRVMQSRAATVAEYLAQLPADRRSVVEAVRRVMRENLDEGFDEAMQYGMIAYQVPHRTFPAGYHCDPKQPLPAAGLAAQKNYYSIYIMPMWDDGSEPARRFRRDWEKTGRKLDMGKCCVRFKRLEDVALDVLGAALRAYRVEEYVADYLAQLAARGIKHQGLKFAPAAPAAGRGKKGAAAEAKATPPAKTPVAKAAKVVPGAVKKTAPAKPARDASRSRAGKRAAPRTPGNGRAAAKAKRGPR
jgi:hypothetical protein